MGAVEIYNLAPAYNSSNYPLPNSIGFTNVIPRGFEPDLPVVGIGDICDAYSFSFLIYDNEQDFIRIGEIHGNDVNFYFNTSSRTGDLYEWISWRRAHKK